MITLDDIRQLLDTSDSHTLTLYLNVDGSVRENQSQTPAWRIWLKDALKRIEGELKDGQYEPWKDIRDRVERFLEYYQPNAKSLVLFYGPEAESRFELPVTLGNQASFGKLNVTPLLWAVDEYEPYLVMLVDREKVRFFTSSLGSVGFDDIMEIDIGAFDFAERTNVHPAKPLGDGSAGAVHGGSGRDDFENTVDAYRHRFYRDVASKIEKLLEERGIDRLILGGVEESAHEVRRQLPDTVAKCLVGIVPIPMRAGAQEIFNHILPTAQTYERQKEAALVDEVINLTKSGGRGALGRKEVLDALEQRRAELVIAPWPMDDDLAAELPEKTFKSGGSVELVHGEAAERIKAEGGLAARLYYTVGKR